MAGHIKGVENDNSNGMVDIIQKQQEFYKIFGHKTSVTYDYLDKTVLQAKIDLILPEMDATKKLSLIDQIWYLRKCVGNNVLYMSLIFVFCTYDVKIESNKESRNIKSKIYSIHPVFRVRKCWFSTEDVEKQYTKLCAVFIDKFGRAYENWENFCGKNKYSDSVIVAPKHGIYNGSQDDGSDDVLLDIFERRSKLNGVLDTGASIFSIASAGVGLATLIPAITVAPLVAKSAVITGISCAVYTGKFINFIFEIP